MLFKNLNKVALALAMTLFLGACATQHRAARRAGAVVVLGDRRQQRRVHGGAALAAGDDGVVRVDVGHAHPELLDRLDLPLRPPPRRGDARAAAPRLVPQGRRRGARRLCKGAAAGCAARPGAAAAGGLRGDRRAAVPLLLLRLDRAGALLRGVL